MVYACLREGKLVDLCLTYYKAGIRKNMAEGTFKKVENLTENCVSN